MMAYHDTEWGVPVHDDPTHFEFLVLEGAQAGLELVDHPEPAGGLPQGLRRLRRRPRWRASPRPGSRSCWPTRGSSATGPRWRSTVRNARAFLAVQEEFGSFDAYIWGFVGGSPLVHKWRRTGQLPAVTAESEAFSADLRRRGFRFVGPTIVYAHLQATGLINDHLVRLLPLRGRSQVPTHEDPDAEAAHHGLFGLAGRGRRASRRPSPASTNPSEA